MSSPLIRAKEMEIVYERIEACTSIDQMGYASLLVDEFEKSQPEEREIIQDMRDLVCDLTFKFFLEKYPTQKC